MNSLKKMLSSILAISLVVGFALTSAMAATSPENAEQEIEILPLVDRPEIDLMESLAKESFVGAYWDEDEFHIIPIQEFQDEIEAAVISATKERRSNMPTIVIDNAPLETRSGEHVYSMAEREAAKAYLLEHKDTLNIQAVGFSADKLSVFMNPEATDEDRDAVRNASPVKALEFSNALFGNEGDGKNESPNGNDQGIQGRASDVTLRGGNRIKRTANEKWGWATITISAVRNWDANTKTGDIGLLTCGHGWTDGQDVFASDSTNIGDIDVQLYRNMDAGFILLDNPKLNSHGYMSDGKRITENRAVSEYDVGDAVKKYGAATGSYPLSGKITQTSISGDYWGKDDTEFYFDNLFVIDCINRSGDSGGAVVVGDAILGMVKGAYGVDYDKNTDTYSRTVVMPIRDIMAKTDFLPCK